MQQHTINFALECRLLDQDRTGHRCPAVDADHDYSVEIGEPVPSDADYPLGYVKFLSQPASPAPLPYGIKSQVERKEIPQPLQAKKYYGPGGHSSVTTDCAVETSPEDPASTSYFAVDGTECKVSGNTWNGIFIAADRDVDVSSNAASLQDQEDRWLKEITSQPCEDCIADDFTGPKAGVKDGIAIRTVTDSMLLLGMINGVETKTRVMQVGTVDAFGGKVFHVERVEIIFVEGEAPPAAAAFLNSLEFYNK